MKTDGYIFDGERVDETGFGELRLIQKPDEFCYGVDAVILADFAAKASGSGRLQQRNDTAAADLGTGTGIIPLILTHKTLWKKITGIEVQKNSFDRACRNAAMNKLEERLEFVNGDVKDYASEWGRNLRESFDVVTTNPPYTESCGGMKSHNTAKAIARHETTAGLEDFMSCASWLLKPKGELFMVHRPSRLVDICCLGRKYKLEPKELRFVSPDISSPPNIILVHFVKGGGRQLTLLDPLAVYGDDGSYTDELCSCYR